MGFSELAAASVEATKWLGDRHGGCPRRSGRWPGLLRRRRSWSPAFRYCRQAVQEPPSGAPLGQASRTALPPGYLAAGRRRGQGPGGWRACGVMLSSCTEIGGRLFLGILCGRPLTSTPCARREHREGQSRLPTSSWVCEAPCCRQAGKDDSKPITTTSDWNQ